VAIFAFADVGFATGGLFKTAFDFPGPAITPPGSVASLLIAEPGTAMQRA
jgi:hypothetical protein